MRSIIVVILLLITFNAFSQDRIDSAMTFLSEKYPQEKIHLSYNKSSYLAGETIWFKGFVFSGYHLTDISTNLYIEVLDAHKSIVCKNKFPIIQGLAEGSLSLPDSIAEGSYFVRAYTQWMLNFSESFQYIQALKIYNSSSQKKLQTHSAAWTAGAFVEGGNLINNRNANVAIRLHSVGVLPLNWSGYLVDTQNPSIKINSFVALDENIATTNFIPVSGRTYQIVVEDNAGITQSIALPPVLLKGVGLSVEQTDTTLGFRIDFAENAINQKYKLVGTIDNDIVYRYNVKNIDTVLTHRFSTKEMPKGVLRLTLFDSAYAIVAERLCFLFNQNSTRPIFDSVKINALPRALNEFSIVADSSKRYLFFVQEATEQNNLIENGLLSACWLTQDFKTKIHGAEKYFLYPIQVNKKILDAILVTEQWTRFSWQDILAKKFPYIKYNKDNFLTFTAKAVYNKKPLINETINLIVFQPDSTKQVLQAKSDLQGQFLLDGLAYEGDAKVSYRATGRRIVLDSVKINFTEIEANSVYQSALPKTADSLVIPTVEKNSIAQKPFEQLDFNNIKETNKEVHELKEVTVKTHVQTPTELLDEKLSSGRFYNPRSMIYDFVNKEQPITAGSDLFNWLKARVPGDPKLTSYYIDEFLINKQDAETQISGLGIDIVAMIKIQGRGATHQVFIYLKRGAEMYANVKPLSNIVLNGYTKSKAYTQPDYSNPKYKNWPSDTRSILYWGNSFQTDSGRQPYKIQFYNNDKAREFRVIVLTIDENEAPQYFEKILNTFDP
jgi:hypothetical protein